MNAVHVRSTTIAGFPALETTADGNRPPLLFMHGSFVDHLHFKPWMEVLAARGWRSVAPARRGRAGVGPEKARGLSIADYLQDTLAVIRTLDRKPIVVGHSLGGLIAQKLMNRAKSRQASSSRRLQPRNCRRSRSPCRFTCR